jgi:hypothetical protein
MNLSFKSTAVLIITTLFYISCADNATVQENKNSRVEHFEYQGYGDTVVAMLFGEILTAKKDSPAVFIPLPDVLVTVDSLVKTVKTDNKGQFELGLFSGTYKLIINKPGYQPLQISQYVADGDRVSIVKIILSLGDSLQNYSIPRQEGKE